MLGSAAVSALADQLTTDLPRDRFKDELARIQIKDWAEEGIGIAIKTEYHDLDAEQTRFVDLPNGYATDARRAAK